MMRHLPLVLAVAACIALAWELVVLLPQMPETMATSFGFDGAARNYMSRGVFGWLMGGIMLSMAVGFVLVRLIPGLPDRLINISAKDYWLAPERREATLTDIVAIAQWILASAMALIAGTAWLSIEANRSTPPRLANAFFWMMGAYVAVFVFALRHVARRFRRPRE